MASGFHFPSPAKVPSPPRALLHLSLLLLLHQSLLIHQSQGQLPPSMAGPPPSLQVKITSLPLPVSSAQHLAQLVFTVVGRSANERVFCVSETPVSQLRFVCLDCVQRNISDMLDFLNAAQDLTHVTGFPTVTLPTVDASPAWTGANIMCQAAVNGGTKDSQVSVVEVRYLRSVHVVDSNGQGPVLIPNQGFHFYVECVRGPDGLCQPSARRKSLHCSVQANPPANQFRWLKNGQVVSGNGPEITIGAEMVGHSLQCAANNGLYGDDMLKSEAVSIDPYSAARLIQDNFQQAQSSAPFQPGNRVEMNQRVQLSCVVEGNPRPVVFWKLRRPNGQVVDAPCPQGMNGQYRELPATVGQQPGSPPPVASNLIRLQALCELLVANYSFSGQYWCSACSYVSQGLPECSPGLDGPGERVLNMQVQGPPQQSEAEPSVEQQLEDHSNAIVLVHFCAEPSPRPPRELVFTIDGNDLQIGQQWQNFAFETVVQNNTVPNCFVARLRIMPVHEDDQNRQISLKVQNQYGTKHIPVSLSDLLGTNSSELGGLPNTFVWLGVALVLILLCCAVIYCLRTNRLCFDRMKNGQQYSSDNLKAGVPDTYTDDPTGRQQPMLFGNGNGNEVMRPPSAILEPSPAAVYMSREAVV